MKILRNLRLGEYATIGWMLFVVVIFLFNQQAAEVEAAKKLFRSPPLLLVTLLLTALYAVPFLHLNFKKLRISLELLANPHKPVENLQTWLGFSHEKQMVRLMARFFRDVAPLCLIVVLYPSTDLVLRLLQRNTILDQSLIQIDFALFHIHLSVWMEQFTTPQLTDLMSLFYALHLVFPVITILYISRFSTRKLFIHTIQGYVIVSVIGFILYILVPGIGPKYTLVHLYTKDLQTGMLGAANQAIIDATRVPRDVFPSLHVGLSAILMINSFRANRWFGLAVLPFTLGNWVSTIYLRYHYTIDVVAGLVVVFLADALVLWWAKKFPDTDMETSLMVTELHKPEEAPGGTLEKETS